MRFPRLLTPLAFGLMAASCDSNIVGTQPTLEPLRDEVLVGETIIMGVGGTITKVTVNPDAGIVTWKKKTATSIEVTCKKEETVDITIIYGPVNNKGGGRIVCKCPCGCSTTLISRPSMGISGIYVLGSRSAMFDESSCHEQGSSG